MPKKIQFSDLVAKIQTNKITRDEMEKFFSVDETRSRPFAPALTLNFDAINAEGIERSAKLAAPALAAEAGLASRSNRLGRDVADAAPIVAEGDSWFNLPDVAFPETLVDILQQEQRLTNLAMFGDELEEMVLRAEYMEPLSSGKVQYLMFSGGGNDVVGETVLTRCINLFDPHHTDPKQAAFYVNGEFDVALNKVDRLYRRLAAQVRSIAPNTKLVVHGYDYAVPRADGPFLGKRLEQLGHFAEQDGGLSEAIVRVMIDRFNVRLKQLPAENVIYVDLRKTAKSKNDWFDELHPTTATAKKLAAKFKAVLKLKK